MNDSNSRPAKPLSPMISRVNAFCQGQAFGRCSVIRRAERASRAGTWMRVRRIVAVVAFANRPARSAITPAVRVRFAVFPGIFMLRLGRSEEHTSELQSLLRISYAVFCLKKK